jgi:uncharacterized protein involved in oxidation of intracellular sulfur
VKILIIFNREPYDNTDVTWNGLRLAGTLRKRDETMRIFLMNDSVDMARCGIYKNHPYFEGAEKATMADLAEWVVDSDKVLTF